VEIYCVQVVLQKDCHLQKGYRRKEVWLDYTKIVFEGIFLFCILYVIIYSSESSVNLCVCN
jgi:hypothetical protein